MVWVDLKKKRKGSIRQRISTQLRILCRCVNKPSKDSKILTDMHSQSIPVVYGLMSPFSTKITLQKRVLSTVRLDKSPHYSRLRTAIPGGGNVAPGCCTFCWSGQQQQRFKTQLPQPPTTAIAAYRVPSFLSIVPVWVGRVFCIQTLIVQECLESSRKESLISHVL